MAEQLVSQYHGPNYRAAAVNRVYTGVVGTAGIALIVAATTGNHPTLWNPSSSKRNVSIIRLEVSWISGNNAPGAVYWHHTPNTGDALAVPILTFTAVNPVGVVGGALDNKARWAPAVSTYTAIPGFLRPTGLSLFTGIGATAVAPFILEKRYDGDFIVAPGNAVHLCTQAATTTALLAIAVVWEEIDLV